MAGRGSRAFTGLSEIWAILKAHAPRDEWLPIDRIYALVREHGDLRPGDFERAAPESRQTKWERNVRNVLQHRKSPRATRPAELMWDPPTRSYLLPKAPGALPPAALGGPEDEYAPKGARSFEPDPFDDAALASIVDARRFALRAIAVRQGRSAFRNALMAAYGQRCAVSRTRAAPALDAAHIVPYRGRQTDHVANGLLLRADVHTLFDLGLIAVHPLTLRVKTAPELEDTDYEALAEQALLLPEKENAQPSQRSLLHHYSRSRVVA